MCSCARSRLTTKLRDPARDRAGLQPKCDGVRCSAWLGRVPGCVSMSSCDFDNRVEIQLLIDVRKHSDLHQICDDSKWLLTQDGSQLPNRGMRRDNYLADNGRRRF